MNKTIEITMKSKPIPYISLQIKVFPKLKALFKSNLPKNKNTNKIKEKLVYFQNNKLKKLN